MKAKYNKESFFDFMKMKKDYSLDCFIRENKIEFFIKVEDYNINKVYGVNDKGDIVVVLKRDLRFILDYMVYKDFVDARDKSINEILGYEE